MTRSHTSFLALAVVCGGALLLSNPAQSQLGVAKDYVQVQPTTPGTAQSGNSNISGTSRAAQFVGGGAGITGLNASNISNGTLNASRLPVPMNLITATAQAAISVNSGFSGEGAFAIAASMSTSVGTNPSPAIFGSNLGPGSNAVGVWGQSGNSGIGVTGVGGIGGVRGITSSALAGSYGVSGTVTGTLGTGVLGVASGATGNTFGVRGETSSPDGIGVQALNSTGNTALAVQGKTQQFGHLNIRNSFGLSIGSNADPVFPLDFSESLGSKISLFGGNPNAHYGFGISASNLLVHTDFINSYITFGYGGATNFSPSVRVNHELGGLDFRPLGENATSRTTAPYDFILHHDVNNNDIDSWFRIFNSNFTETVRVLDGDEANTQFDGAVLANGIDFAEGFKVADPSIEPGDLVVNSGDWEFINRSSSAYQRGVIGVVSTKPAFVAGMSFETEEKMDPALTKRRDEARRKGDWKLEKALTKQMRRLVEEAYRPVAFMGRVPVKVSGPVKIGDHLTASSIPGVAMAMTKGGHSIGIALEASAGGQTKVMAMIQPGHVTLPETQPNGTLIDQVTSMRSEIDALRSQLREMNDLKAEIRELRKLVQATGRKQ